mmetsp:Transcript_17125/g.37854  ORF Transcript_17125/g.37854 Transcript_17125/m.37854 type:complete len:118 (-) Transcript_17125:915-1268(-)
MLLPRQPWRQFLDHAWYHHDGARRRAPPGPQNQQPPVPHGARQPVRERVNSEPRVNSVNILLKLLLKQYFTKVWKHLNQRDLFGLLVFCCELTSYHLAWRIGIWMLWLSRCTLNVVP